MEVGVPGETTVSVHEPVAWEYHSRKDSVIILGMSIRYLLILLYSWRFPATARPFIG